MLQTLGVQKVGAMIHAPWQNVGDAQDVSSIEAQRTGALVGSGLVVRTLTHSAIPNLQMIRPVMLRRAVP